MKRTRISLIIAGLFAVGVTPAVAQVKWTGSAAVTGIGMSSTSGNRFRLEEYRDLSTGAFGSFDFEAETPTHLFRLHGDNIGRDDYLLDFSGQKFDDYKFQVYTNQIRHNQTFGARTPWTGIGSNTLTYPGAPPATPTTNVSLWNPFTYRVDHENTGGLFEISRGSPFYFRTTANYKESKGLRTVGTAGTSPGGPAYELPKPIDFNTTDVGAEFGYATRTQQYSVNVSYSKFSDQNDFLFWRNPSITSPLSTTLFERQTIAADNEQWKVALNALWRQLPLGSTIAVRGTYSSLTNDIPIAPRYTTLVGAVGVERLSGANASTFEGDITRTTFSASITSAPIRDVDTRLYYNYNRKDNDSTRIVFTPAVAPGQPAVSTGGGCDINLTTGAAGPTCSNELFHYRKHQIGAEANYRLNRTNRFGAGLEYTDTERERHDFDRSKDWKVFAEWRNTYFENVSTRLKYQYLDRDSEFLQNNVPATNPDAPFVRFLWRYDVAPMDQHLVKGAIEYSPLPLVDLGAELIFKQNDYKTPFLGRQRDDRRELYLSAAFGDPKQFRVTTFFDVEFTQNKGQHFQGDTTTFPNNNAAGTAFLWRDNVEEKSWVVGIAGEWPMREWLKFYGSVLYQDTQGTVDFNTQNNVGNPQNIGAYDSFRKLALHLKATSPIRKDLEITGGVAFERYKFSDLQLNDYNYTPVAGGQNYLSGAYAFQSYNARIAYVTLRYILR